MDKYDEMAERLWDKLSLKYEILIPECYIRDISTALRQAAAEERETCAQVAENRDVIQGNPATTAWRIADAIRAREAK